MNLYRNGFFRWPPFYISLLVAAVGGWILGANGGAADFRWTETIYFWIQNRPNRSLLTFLEWLSFEYGGQLLTIALIVGSASYWLFSLRKGRKATLSPKALLWLKNVKLIILAAILIGLCSPLLKAKFARERPHYYNENIFYTPWYDFYLRNRDNLVERRSFPSGHTLQATLVLGTVHWLGQGLPLVWKGILLKPIFAGLGVFYVALMGFSRVALGRHWLADVFFAAIIGFWIVSFSAWIIHRKQAKTGGGHIQPTVLEDE